VGRGSRLQDRLLPKNYNKNNGVGMFKLMSSGAIALMSIGAVLVPLSISQVASGRPAAAVKGDRLDINLRSTKCAGRFYDAACLYDGSGGARDAHKVHVIVVGGSSNLEKPTAPRPQTRRSPKQDERCASLPPSCWSPKGMHAASAITGRAEMPVASEIERV
jgi:hypothetical protein